MLVRSLVSGTDPVLADRADPQTVAASGCAHVSLVPTQLRRLLADESRPGDITANDRTSALSAFSSVLLGGAAAPGGLLEAARAARVPVVTTYGMTETCGGCVYDGVPLDGVRVEVGGEDGRIRIAGPVLFSGYRPRGPRGPGGSGGNGFPPGTGGVWGGSSPREKQRGALGGGRPPRANTGSSPAT